MLFSEFVGNCKVVSHFLFLYVWIYSGIREGIFIKLVYILRVMNVFLRSEQSELLSDQKMIRLMITEELKKGFLWILLVKKMFF